MSGYGTSEIELGQKGSPGMRGLSSYGPGEVATMTRFRFFESPVGFIQNRFAIA
jgi:hypothetical protein